MYTRECGAEARTNGNRPCRNFAMANGRCRFHGGKSTGAKTKEGKEKIASANTKHGFYSKSAKAERRLARYFINSCRATGNDRIF